MELHGLPDIKAFPEQAATREIIRLVKILRCCSLSLGHPSLAKALLGGVETLLVDAVVIVWFMISLMLLSLKIKQVPVDIYHTSPAGDACVATRLSICPFLVRPTL